MNIQPPLWYRIDHTDPRALIMADRHYSRQSPGTPEFTPTGNKVVLMHFIPNTDIPAAIWASHRPDPNAGILRADKRDVWACTMFRVEHHTVPASDLIKEAVAITCDIWTPLPRDGFYTTINPRKVKPIKRRGKDLWGYCYLKAGWEIQDTRTKRRNLIVLILPIEKLKTVTPIKAETSIPPFGISWRKWPRPTQENQLQMDL